MCTWYRTSVGFLLALEATATIVVVIAQFLGNQKQEQTAHKKYCSHRYYSYYRWTENVWKKAVIFSLFLLGKVIRRDDETIVVTKRIL